MEEVELQEEITFYSFLGHDAKGRALPSSQVVHISGGERRLASDGGRVTVPLREARFHNGIFHTADPEIIKELRRLAKVPGTGITENKEVFYGATMTPEQKVQRANILAGEQAKVMEEKDKEINKLRQMLEERGGQAKNPRKEA
jgi:hypothetical protein